MTLNGPDALTAMHDILHPSPWIPTLDQVGWLPIPGVDSSKRDSDRSVQPTSLESLQELQRETGQAKNSIAGTLTRFFDRRTPKEIFSAAVTLNVAESEPIESTQDRLDIIIMDISTDLREIWKDASYDPVLGTIYITASGKFLKRLLAHPSLISAEVYGGKPNLPDTPQAQEKSQRAIGRAFKNSLLAGLSARLKNIGRYFSSLPHLPKKEQRGLREAPDVQEALPESELLVRYGLSPLKIFYATEAMLSLIQRLIKRKLLPIAPKYAVFKANSHSKANHTPNGLLILPESILVREIAFMTQSSIPASRALLRWMMDVSKVKPLVFSGIKVKALAHGIQLIRLPKKRMRSLFKRWAAVATGL